MDQSADAMMWYQDALKLRPNDAETHVNLAEAYIRLGRMDDAVESLRKALSLRPSHARAHCHLGLIYLDRKLVTLARMEFDAAARFDPTGTVGQASASLAALIRDSQQQQAFARQQGLQQQLLQPAGGPPKSSASISPGRR
jgi:tetratricopeptide (TPR) repeat protein